jgi:molybdate transport system permease protein
LGIIALSLRAALVGVLGSPPLAVVVAYVLARFLPWKMLFDAIVHLPLVLPPVVVGRAARSVRQARSDGACSMTGLAS